MGKIRGYLNLKPHKDASEQATNYVTDIGSNGIFVHPEGEGPDDTQTPTGWKIADAIELFRSGVSYIKAWIDNNIPKIRVGKEDGGHVLIQSSGMDVYGGDGTKQLAHIGYDTGTAQSGTAVAPFYSFGERDTSQGVGNYSVAEGRGVVATGYCSHAEGDGSQAKGGESHAEGYRTQATNKGAHSEGYSSTVLNILASGLGSHAEGYAYDSPTEATGIGAHAEGRETLAYGEGAHSEGYGTIAYSDHQHAQGKYNKQDTNGTYADIVGGGTSSARKNIEATTWTGDKRMKGDVYVGCNDDSTGGNKVLSVTNIRSGRFQSAQVSNGTYQDKVITFSPAFATTPHVIACLSTDVTALQTTNLQISVINISTTGCTIRVANNQAGSRSPYVEWIAVGL